MKRLLLGIFLALASTAGVVVLTGASDDKSGREYKVEFDNAFGLVEGADLKIGGVRAGQLKKMELDRKSNRALVSFTVTQTGFGSLRTDATCAIRPQSLIGEYFVNCDPGKAREELKEGATIPVERTTSTVPIDLVNNILRRPRRERLRILISELGAGVGGRAEDLNEAIRRAVPAIRETDRVLRMLARQNETLRDLTADSDTVMAALAGNKRDVSRFVAEARDTARVSAERRDDLAAQIRELPGFLEELEPTMVSLGEVADEQVPTLRNLDAAAGDLETFFDRLGPFSDATKVNVRSLARAARKGRGAIRQAGATVAELRRTTTNLPELANNLAIILRDLDDRGRAIEKDPRSPGGEGYTGLEALLQYFYDQAMAINIFDDNGYILKIALHVDKCSDYQNAETIKELPQKDVDDCMADLGPQQQGVNAPDPTAGSATATARSKKKKSSRAKQPKRERQPARPAQPRATPTPTAAPTTEKPSPTPTPAPSNPLAPVLDNVGDLLEDILPPLGIDPEKLGLTPEQLRKLDLDALRQLGREGQTTQSGGAPQRDTLLDFLFAP